MNITDAIAKLQWVYLGGPASEEPGPGGCGPDPSTDILAEFRYLPERCMP